MRNVNELFPSERRIVIEKNVTLTSLVVILTVYSSPFTMRKHSSNKYEILEMYSFIKYVLMITIGVFLPRLYNEQTSEKKNHKLQLFRHEGKKTSIDGNSRQRDTYNHHIIHHPLPKFLYGYGYYTWYTNNISTQIIINKIKTDF